MGNNTTITKEEHHKDTKRGKRMRKGQEVRHRTIMEQWLVGVWHIVKGMQVENLLPESENRKEEPKISEEWIQ